MKLTKKVVVMLSQDDWDALKKEADKVSLPLSSYLRVVIVQSLDSYTIKKDGG